MKRIVVHVGLPKCGSSSIQATFARERGRLRDAGILYPEMRARYERGDEAGVAPGHMVLRAEIRKARRHGGRMPILDATLREFDASNARTLVLSSEGFFFLFEQNEPKFVPSLRERFVGRDVEVVSFHRRRDRFALSQYKQIVKDFRRFGGTLADMIGDPDSQVMRRTRIDPAAQLATVGEAFAARTCTPICLDAPGSDAVALPGERIGVDVAANEGGGGGRTNASPSDVETAYLAWCNARCLPDDAYYARRVALEDVDLTDVAPGFRTAADATLRDLAAGTEADYAALDRAYGFAHPPVIPPVGNRPADVLTAEVIAEIERRVEAVVAGARRRIETRARSLALRRATILRGAEAKRMARSH